MIRFIAAAALLALASCAALELGCTTDTECMALCPADDLACDGGPQS